MARWRLGREDGGRTTPRGTQGRGGPETMTPTDGRWGVEQGWDEVATAGMVTAGDDTRWRKRWPEGGAADQRRSSDPGDATADSQEGAGDGPHDDSGGCSGAW
ncbi:hypothetical protein E2562_026298 [Oryza meyeriana var. granulata]|uniref:DUF834 domain-containing protein n=1 Tax=Oryza meyeriana var. granulata TaxID=110450 RepID=A0A6G1C7E2_9ORYZ|nr:hypothetical protein E2562_026298 [Oryza meyeriana var. granulata]